MHSLLLNTLHLLRIFLFSKKVIFAVDDLKKKKKRELILYHRATLNVLYFFFLFESVALLA